MAWCAERREISCAEMPADCNGLQAFEFLFKMNLNFLDIVLKYKPSNDI